MQDKKFLPGKGDKLYRDEKYIAAVFGGKRKVLSTSPQNGGLRADLKAVYNYDGRQDGKKEIRLEGGTYESHMRYVSDSIIGLSADSSSGIMTAASMKNASYVKAQYREIAVSVIATGGIEVNGGRAGDRASWYEKDGNWVELGVEHSHTLGTINIMIFINADLTDGALAKALIICTEAKTAAIQELCIASRYSHGLATGSGTDGTIIVADLESDFKITETGTHSKIGEIIGCTVKEAVMESLFLQTGASARMQHNAFRRLERFCITADAAASRAVETGAIEPAEQAEFKRQAEKWACCGGAVSWAALEAHLLDEREWGMLKEKEVLDAERKLLCAFGMDGFHMEENAVLMDHIIFAIKERI